MHLYTIHTTDGRAIDARARSPWAACALAGVLVADVASITLIY